MGQPLRDKKTLSSFSRFKKALTTLEMIVMDSNRDNEYIQDATIKRFEYTYEAAWRAVKFALEAKGVYEIHPTDIFREAFTAGWIRDAEIFRQMIQDRNTTSHQYAEYKADEIYERIGTLYYPELKRLLEELEGVVYGHS